MKQIKRYKVEIKGNRPLVYNRMKREIEDARKKLKKDELSEYEEQNWVDKAECCNGNAILPSEWLHSMLINACRQTGLIPYYATKKIERYTRYVQSMLFPQKPPIHICKKSELEQLGGHYKSQPNKMNSGKVWKVFPMKSKWSAEFEVVDPFGRMKISELKELLEYGGMFIGVGDQRIRGFGRFDVLSVKELK